MLLCFSEARVKNFSKVIFCQETCTRKFTNKQDLEYALENYDLERPIMYPDSMRINQITFTVIDCKDKTVAIFTKTIKKNDTTVEVLDKDYVFVAPEAGFGSLDTMISSFINGYQVAKKQIRKH